MSALHFLLANHAKESYLAPHFQLAVRHSCRINHSHESVRFWKQEVERFRYQQCRPLQVLQHHFLHLMQLIRHGRQQALESPAINTAAAKSEKLVH